MTDKTLYFLRHGEAESNANHFFAGQADVALTPRGVAQAKAAAPLLAHIAFDKCFAVICSAPKAPPPWHSPTASANTPPIFGRSALEGCRICILPNASKHTVKPI